MLEPVYNGDTAELIRGFIGARKKWISDIFSVDVKHYVSRIIKMSIQ
jgi:hypothetical protein